MKLATSKANALAAVAINLSAPAGASGIGHSLGVEGVDLESGATGVHWVIADLNGSVATGTTHRVASAFLYLLVGAEVVKVDSADILSTSTSSTTTEVLHHMEFRFGPINARNDITITSPASEVELDNPVISTAGGVRLELPDQADRPMRIWS